MYVGSIIGLLCCIFLIACHQSKGTYKPCFMETETTINEVLGFAST